MARGAIEEMAEVGNQSAGANVIKGVEGRSGGGTMLDASTGQQRVTIGPALDVRNVASVRADLYAALESGVGDLVIDMNGVSGIDAAGLGMVTAAHLRAQRSGRRLVLQNCSADLRRVLAVTRLNRILNIDRTATLLV